MEISIIIPTYNCEKFIKETLDSVFSQSFSDFEVIIIDDCSSDHTIEIIKACNDKRIKLFVNETNKGAAYSRNLGISKANGNYVAFLDGDDVWAPNKLEQQLLFMKSNSIDFCCADYELIDKDSKRIGILYTSPKIITYKMFLRIDYIGTSTVIYKRSVFPTLSIPNDILKRNDDAMWLLLSKKVSCYRFDKVCAYYRKSDGTISSGKKSKLFKHHVLLYQKLYGFGRFKSFLFATRNVLYYILKQIKYKKKVRID